MLYYYLLQGIGNKLKKGKKMKVLQEVVEVSGEGLESLIGKRVTLFCANYFYVGKLISVNLTCVKLENAAIVYQTGAFTDKNYADEQPLGCKEFYVQTAAIESFGVIK
jgi:hypothetical protein